MTSSVRKEFPRLPLDGKIDLTYRCNNNCRHCWLWLPPGAPQGRDELSFGELRRIVDEARQMGCQAWAISGGEPMLRPDFPEIFDYVTRKAVRYSLNTNGALITPDIARLMARRGEKMVAVYGATAGVHDDVTRTPGSFQATMRGFAYLKEAKAGFTVQIIPMRQNYHQYGQMLELAESLSPHYRVGASWLYLSACGSVARNREIADQRLDAATVVVLDPPNPASELLEATGPGATAPACRSSVQGDDRLFASCIAARRDFHIDPYGKMTFCCFVKDPALRFDLHAGSFRQAWDEFIPSLAEKVRGGQEYLQNCGSCDLRQDCHWCAVYGHLEYGRFSAKVDYLCQVAQKTHNFKRAWKMENVRYYQIAGITIQLAADFPFREDTFAPKFAQFRVDGPGPDTVSYQLKSPVPTRSELRLGREVYRRPPWAICRQSRSWAYLGIAPGEDELELHSLAIFGPDHSSGTIYRPSEYFQAGNLQALITAPTDQIVLAPLLAERQGCILHASGIIMDGKGLLFVGHSEAGKSTMLKILRDHGEVLCDDRIIVRRWPEGFRIHGTWSHGELPDVSPAGAPLAAMIFLDKATTNELIPITDKVERLSRLLSHVVKPVVTADWWEKTLALAGRIAVEVPIYRLRFDMSGQVVGLLKQL
jgi:MoaA/NifB/PqqE/SkfB family radical SAM enzyme